MFDRSRFVAGASALVLAAATALGGAAVASAEEDGATGSLSGSGLNLGDVAAQLELAATALNGPVKVSPNEEGGPTVTYTNTTKTYQECAGFTMPYSTVEELGIDPSGLDLTDLSSALGLLTAIDAEGGTSVLGLDRDTNTPTSFLGTPQNGGIVGALAPVMLALPNRGVAVEPGESAEWVAVAPGVPSAALVLCGTPTAEEHTTEASFGIDPQVVADQINGKIPGGSVEVVSADSISGGSVESGATALGSLASAGAGGDAETEEPPVEEPAE